METTELGAVRTKAGIFRPLHAYKTLENFCNILLIKTSYVIPTDQ